MTHHMPPPTEPTTRLSIAEMRRDQMRLRLIESAILVFAERGPHDVVIGDVIAAAGVARGSFYNHFRSNEQLVEAACLAICSELVETLGAETAGAQTAAESLFAGIALMMGIAQDYPVLGRFMSMLSLRSNAQLTDLGELLPSVITRGIAAGEFQEEDLRAILDLTLGMIRQGAMRLTHHPAPPADADAFIRSGARLVLRALGVSASRIAQVVDAPLPRITLSPDSLLAKAQARHAEALSSNAQAPLSEDPSSCPRG